MFNTNIVYPFFALGRACLWIMPWLPKEPCQFTVTINNIINQEIRRHTHDEKH